MLNILKKTAVSAALAGSLLAGATSASAAPVLGASVFYGGGPITITSGVASSGFVSELRLYDPTTLTAISGLLMNDEPSGVVVSLTDLDLAGFGIGIGDELLFGIYVVDTMNTFFMGAASRNPDGVLHAGVDVIDADTLIVGFEDILGGGDTDYNDNIFEFTGNLAVPEPGTLFLAGLGLLGLGLMRRR